MNMTRAPNASTVNDQLANWIAFVNDTAGYEAKIAAFQQAEVRAADATAIAEARRGEMDERERSIIAKASGVERAQTQLATDTAALIAERAKFEAERAAKAASLAETTRLQNARERDLNARDQQISTAMDETDKHLRLAKADHAEASALLATLRALAADFAPLSARIAALK